MPDDDLKTKRTTGGERWPGPVMVAVSLALPATALADAYTLSGAIGLRLEDYQYQRDGVSYDRQTLRQELDVSSGGHIWDPRFLRYDIGLNLREHDTRSSQGDSDYSMVGYHLNTTWFGARRNPLNLYASRSSSTVSDFLGPSYDLETRTVGGRWSLDSALLGRIQLSASRMDNLTDGRTVQRDETTDNAAVDGKRQFSGAGGSTSDVNYGYRYHNTTDQARDVTRRQHQFFLSDRTTLSPTAFLTASANYYDRHDVWATQATDPAALVLDSRFFSATANLNVKASERLRYSYGVNASDNSVNDATTATYGGRAGLDYIWNDRWQQHAALTASQTEHRGETVTTTQRQSAESGLRYASQRGNFNVRGGYTLGLEQREEYAGRAIDLVRNSFTAGYSRSHNPLWRDHAEYRVATTHGDYQSAEHNLRYAVTSQPGADDSVNGAVELRDYAERGLTTDQDARSQRYSLSWTRRLYALSSLTVSGGHSRHQGSFQASTITFDDLGEPVGTVETTADSSTRRSHVQARLASTLHKLGNTRVGLLWRHEVEEWSSGTSYWRDTLEGDVNYTIGLWQFQLQYRLREAGGDLGDMREQSLMLHGRRRFGARF